MPAKCKQRERMLTSGFEDIPVLTLGAVRGVLCYRCFGPSNKILKCAACRRAGYCSQECQKLDWKVSHKKQCKVLQSVNELDLQDYCDSRTWAEYRRSLFQQLYALKSMTTSRDTIFIIQAQAHCSTCHRSANQLTNRAIALKACDDCHLLHHCSDCPDSHSKAVCVSYQIQNTFEQFRLQIFEDTSKTQVIECTNTPRTTYKPLENCEGWYNYFVDISDKAFISGKITPDFSSLSELAANTSTAQQEFEENRRLFLMLATDALTMPLTIISALEDLQLINTSTLKIHLLGATSREFLALSCFEEILHLVPALKILDIAAIGPSSLLHEHGNERYASKVDLPCCKDCKSQGRGRLLSSYQGLYHTFVDSAFYEAPSLIVAFNSGWVDGDDAESDWLKTIQLIVKSGIPALFTTYNPQEAHNEHVKMRSLGAEFIKEPAKNKWGGLVPMPEFLDKEYEMWYQNSHFYIIKGQVS
ncbi:hypothetical protein GQ44DRAFT_123671 [Phaeosphaeriaceae sp. PMI808]|nr:hypothetical protein GQ44DRAFT_123671 [Phaeosphaeriaceae sp. PMI808]